MSSGYDPDNDPYGNSQQSGQPGYPSPAGGGYPAVASSGDNGAAALFNAYGQLGTTALQTNAATTQKSIETQGVTTQAQNLGQTQLGLQRQAIQQGLSQQSMNNQANMVESGAIGASGGLVGNSVPNVPAPHYVPMPHSDEYREQKRIARLHERQAEAHERQLEAIRQQTRALRKQAKLQPATQHPAHEPAPMHKMEPSKPLSEGAKRQAEQKAAADARKQKRKEAKAKKIQQQKAQQGEKRREREQAKAMKEQQRAVAG